MAAAVKLIATGTPDQRTEIFAKIANLLFAGIKDGGIIAGAILWGSMKKGGSILLDSIKEGGDKLRGILADFAKNLPEKLKEAAPEIGHKIADGFKKAFHVELFPNPTVKKMPEVDSQGIKNMIAMAHGQQAAKDALEEAGYTVQPSATKPSDKAAQPSAKKPSDKAAQPSAKKSGAKKEPSTTAPVVSAPIDTANVDVAEFNSFLSEMLKGVDVGASFNEALEVLIGALKDTKDEMNKAAEAAAKMARLRSWRIR